MSARTAAHGRAGCEELGSRLSCCISWRDSTGPNRTALWQIVALVNDLSNEPARHRSRLDFGHNAKIYAPFSLRSISANIPRAVFATSLRLPGASSLWFF